MPIADGADLRKRVFHEVACAQEENIRAVNLVELLFEIMKPEDGSGPAGFVGSNAAERDYIFGARILHGGRNRVADTIRVPERVIAGDIRRNHDVGRVCLLQGFGESPGVGDVGDEGLRTFRCERL